MANTNSHFLQWCSIRENPSVLFFLKPKFGRHLPPHVGHRASDKESRRRREASETRIDSRSYMSPRQKRYTKDNRLHWIEGNIDASCLLHLSYNKQRPDRKTVCGSVGTLRWQMYSCLYGYEWYSSDRVRHRGQLMTTGDVGRWRGNSSMKINWSNVVTGQLSTAAQLFSLSTSLHLFQCDKLHW